MNVGLAHQRFDTPVGSLSVFADANGVVRAAGFRPPAHVAALLPAGLAAEGWAEGSLPHVEEAVGAWLDADAAPLSQVPVAQAGGPFFQEVWQATRGIVAGEPVSYQEVAAAAGRPRAMRAAGTACGHNSIALFVPCHRVIASGGRLGQYGPGGPGIKAALLAFEAGWGDAAVLRAGQEASPDALAPTGGVR
ncbi:methylated-DNA--[protein]-cysteine S-methyltransferase [Demequina sp. TTPB684]|uniref:methylated-DNA--[protein]-cysteine S-methyltransferase n=1 Tax=unclassified Demequina TaxID=2620311 RepID=UPI001CF4B67F|nr:MULTISPECIES: methylated-DNA--[protein]-cysteine S-methyltransferase [unclassified Demequina]MCB2411879.1 methylated-DNA--[protein]-cysteine S-methyltransferase [Demequina sp. TTPB684]UPU87617.1 methylated-DNA--[protein]-cysteine S-methyltransferase [Demequina sp. TMPB413]